MSTAFSTRHRKRHKLKAEINVVPYIDVMLVLLIIFMATAPMLTLSVEVDLPDAKAKAVNTDKKPIIVSVDKDGKLSIKIEDAAYQNVNSEELMARIEQLTDGNTNLTVFVAGDKDVSYGTVSNVMALLKDAKVKSVGLLTDDKAGK